MVINYFGREFKPEVENEVAEERLAYVGRGIADLNHDVSAQKLTSFLQMLVPDILL